ncbi:MAG TPA: hypothetical protein VNF49_05590 [Candidatus Binataceae bacterium]|nr:hypothetical protein [Candidatus Binataceae bacterium]
MRHRAPVHHAENVVQRLLDRAQGQDHGEEQRGRADRAQGLGVDVGDEGHQAVGDFGRIGGQVALEQRADDLGAAQAVERRKRHGEDWHDRQPRRVGQRRGPQQIVVVLETVDGAPEYAGHTRLERAAQSRVARLRAPDELGEKILCHDVCGPQPRDTSGSASVQGYTKWAGRRNPPRAADGLRAMIMPRAVFASLRSGLNAHAWNA